MKKPLEFMGLYPLDSQMPQCDTCSLDTCCS